MRIYPPGKWPLFIGEQSDEIWRHHMETHFRECGLLTSPDCDVTMSTLRCPCGRTVTMSCAKCGQPLIVGRDETVERCEHYLFLRSLRPSA